MDFPRIYYLKSIDPIEILKEAAKESYKYLAKLPNLITENTLELLEKFKKRCHSLKNLFDDGNEDVKSDLLKSALWN